MESKNTRCAGIDVHKDSLKVAVRVDGRETVETFGTTSDEIFRLGDWLAEHVDEPALLELIEKGAPAGLPVVPPGGVACSVC